MMFELVDMFAIGMLLMPFFRMGARQITYHDLALILFGVAAILISLFTYLEIVPGVTRIIVNVFIAVAAWRWWKETGGIIFWWSVVVFSGFAFLNIYDDFIEPLVLGSYRALFISKISSLSVRGVALAVVVYFIVWETRARRFAWLASLVTAGLALGAVGVTLWKAREFIVWEELL